MSDEPRDDAPPVEHCPSCGGDVVADVVRFGFRPVVFVCLGCGATGAWSYWLQLRDDAERARHR